jgi:hypothetical protein
MSLTELKPGMLFDVVGPEDPITPNGVWRLLFQAREGDLHSNGPEPIHANRGNLWYCHPVGKSFIQLICFDQAWDNEAYYHFRLPPTTA